MYDYLIVGSGLFGCVFGREAAEKGKKVLIIEQRSHIGGNCYTENICGINVHRYGPHCFHSNSKKIWDYVNRFTQFTNYEHHGKVRYKNKIYSFPINLMTMAQLWGITTPQEALQKLEEVKIPLQDTSNLENWMLSQVGEEIYETFVKGYTTKQWGRSPKDLPSFIIKRLPLRFTYDDRYFDDEYQGIPVNGYTDMFENMLKHPNIHFETNVDFFDNKAELMRSAKTLVYTGQIDRFYDYTFGQLEYRSLRFETKVLDGDYQGTAIVNHTEEHIPFTRVVEHKHFERKPNAKTVVTWEYPQAYDLSKTPYYPIKDEKNQALYQQYQSLNQNKQVIFGGRLGTYQYYDMHQVIGQALTTAGKYVV